VPRSARAISPGAPARVAAPAGDDVISDVISDDLEK
jgi:hypothetical protein